MEKKTPVFEGKCEEIFKLHNMLAEAGIPHEFLDETLIPIRKMYHIFYPSADEYERVLGLHDTYSSRVCSVIEWWDRYEREKDFLEIRGLLTPEEENADSVCGWLTAENVFERIKAANENRKE